ncbi:MAG: DUF3597 domain-containing protein [Pseudomonadota bacterium]
MGIFSSIKNAIFGQSNDAASAGAAIGASVAAAAPVTVAAAPVDVEAVLNAKLAAKGADLNWQTSIVDLMKLLDMDSSLTSRKELAAELGYDGPLDGSADMNIRLHRAVMKALSVNGGVVPAAMLD